MQTSPAKKPIEGSEQSQPQESDQVTKSSDNSEAKNDEPAAEPMDVGENKAIDKDEEKPQEQSVVKEPSKENGTCNGNNDESGELNEILEKDGEASNSATDYTHQTRCEVGANLSAALKEWLLTQNEELRPLVNECSSNNSFVPVKTLRELININDLKKARQKTIILKRAGFCNDDLREKENSSVCTNHVELLTNKFPVLSGSCQFCKGNFDPEELTQISPFQQDLFEHFVPGL